MMLKVCFVYRWLGLIHLIENDGASAEADIADFINAGAFVTFLTLDVPHARYLCDSNYRYMYN
jgi:hypothetical protein